MPAVLDNNVSAGALRHRVELFRNDGPLDDGREPTEQSAGEVWARVEAMSGQARYMTEQYAERASHVITIRYRPGVDAGMSIAFGATRFQLVYPLNPEYRNIWLHLLCIETAPQAVAA